MTWAPGPGLAATVTVTVNYMTRMIIMIQGTQARTLVTVFRVSSFTGNLKFESI